MTENEQQEKEKEVLRFNKALQSFTPNDYCELGLPNFRDQDFVENVLDCWSSERFKKAVNEIDGKPIDTEQMAEKKYQLLTMTYGTELLIKLRYFVLHTPYYWVLDHNIPKSYYSDPLFIISYELYVDPVSIVLRYFGDPEEIDNAIKDGNSAYNESEKWEINTDIDKLSHFKFRAECEYDVNKLRKLMGSRCHKIIKEIGLSPDTVVDLFTTMSLDDLRNEMGKIEDGHVMIQTVALVEGYTGERNYELG